MPTLSTRATTSTGSARGDDLGDDHGRDRLTLPTLGDIDGGGLVMMTRAMTADCGDALAVSRLTMLNRFRSPPSS